MRLLPPTIDVITHENGIEATPARPADPPALPAAAEAALRWLARKPPWRLVKTRDLLAGLAMDEGLDVSDWTLTAKILPALERHGVEWIPRRGCRLLESAPARQL